MRVSSACPKCDKERQPITETHTLEYKGIILTLYHFPIFKCLDGHMTYEWREIKDLAPKARELFDTNGLVEFDCNNF